MTFITGWERNIEKKAAKQVNGLLTWSEWIIFYSGLPDTTGYQ